MNSKEGKGILLCSGIFLAFCVISYAEFIFMLPYSLHQEAQADRLAVAIQFFDRGMNLFLPRTYHIHATDGITPIEFPIHSYTAALLGHIFGRGNISTCFRMLTLAVGYFGLLSLYLTVFRATKDIISSLFIPFTLLSAPAYAFYICNYMPDAAAVSISFIGFYFLMCFYHAHKFKNIVAAVIFLTLAALIKTSVAVILLSVCGYLLVDLLFLKQFGLNRHIGKLFLLFISSIGLLLAYYLYNQYLGNKYHGFIFLMQIKPFANWDEFKYYFTYSLPNRYLNEYYTVAHYPVLLSVFIIGVVMMFRNKFYRPLLIVAMFSLLGSISLTLLFGGQFLVHNYYFVSIWMPTITLLSLLFFIAIRKQIQDAKPLYVFNGAVVSALIVLLALGYNQFNKMATMDSAAYPGLKAISSAGWMQGGDKVLDKLNIKKDSTILVLDEQPANVGLLYFDRRGINANPSSWRGNIFNVRDYMIDYNIRIMVCDAKKMPEIKVTYQQHFSDIFQELYIDDRCAVYYRKF